MSEEEPEMKCYRPHLFDKYDPIKKVQICIYCGNEKMPFWSKRTKHLERHGELDQ